MQALLSESGVLLYLVSLAATSIALCAAALFVWRLTARRSAPLRHGLLLSAVCLLAVSPLLVAVVMSTGFARWQIGRASEASRPADHELRPEANPPASEPTVVRVASEAIAPETDRPAAAASVQREGEKKSAIDRAAAAAASLFNWQTLIAALAAVWSVGILLRIMFLGRGLLILAKLRRSLVKPKDERVAPLFDRVGREVGISPHTRLFDSPLAPAPLTFGLLRPIVVLPTDLAERLTLEQLRLVLAHEAAHIARFDLFALVFQWLATSLFWWNPLLHAVNRRIERLREHICDDYAALLSGNGRGLAELLITLAEWSPAGRLRVSGATAIVDRAYDDLESRVSRLVEERSISTRLSWPMRCLLVLFAGSLVALSHLTTWSAEPDANEAVVLEAEPPDVEASDPVLGDEPAGGAPRKDEFAAAKQLNLDEWLKRHPDAADHRERVIEQLRAHKSNVFFRQDELNVSIEDPQADDATLGLLKDVGPIHTLTLKRGSYTAAGCKAIARLTDLRALDLGYVDFSAAGFEQLAKLPQLQQLVMNSCPLTDEKLLRLKACQTLERVSIAGEGAAFTADGLAVFASLPAMKGLGVYGPMVTDEGLKQLAACKTLSNLAFGHASVSDEGLLSVGEMKNLRYLMITGNRFTSAGIAHLAPLPLTDLVLRCPELDDASLAVIGGISSLHNLQLSETAVTDDGLASLAGLVEIKLLVIDSPQLTGAGLAPLDRLTELQNLWLSGINISNALFPTLHNFPKLRDLSVGAGKLVERPAVTDAGLEQIPALPALQKILLAGTGITKAGLDALGEKLPGLKSVRVQDSPSYSARSAVWRPRAKPRADENPAASAADRKALIDQLLKRGVMCMEDTMSGLLRVTINSFDATDATLAELKPLGKIGELTLGAGSFSEEGFDTIASFKSLQELSLGRLAISESGIGKLGHLPRLRRLAIGDGSQITGEAIEQMKILWALDTLSIEHADNIEDAGFESLASLPALKNLTLDGDSISDEGLKRLAASKSIATLSLAGAKFSEAGLRSLATMPKLLSLTLNGANVTAAGIRHLKGASHLADLHLTGCPKLNDAALSAIGELTNLLNLSLSGSSMTDAGLANLNGLGGLQSLALGGPRFTGAGLKPLTGLTKLTSLSLHGPEASNEIFAAVHQFPLLQNLHVGAGKPTGSSSITDDGLKTIGQAPNLLVLHLSGTAITDQGLEALVGLPKLTTVFSDWSPGVSKMIWQVQALKDKLAREEGPAESEPGAMAHRQAIIEKLRKLGVPIYSDSPGESIGVVEVQTRKANDATIALLAELGNIRHLSLAVGTYTAACLDSIGKLDELEELTMRRVPMSQAGIEQLARLPHLAKLSILENRDVTDDHLAALKACKSLKKLEFMNPNKQITAQGFEYLAAIPTLEELNFNGQGIDDEAMNRLAESKSISRLQLIATDCTDDGLRAIAAMPNLRQLMLQSRKITSQGLLNLKAAARLEDLQLFECQQLDDAALAAVGQLPHLKNLTVWSDSMTDAGLAHLNSLVGLESLSLNIDSLTGTGLAPLTALVELRTLQMFNKNVSNEVFAHLAQFPKLYTLHLGTRNEAEQLEITDEGLALIGDMPNLQYISFDGTHLTNKGLKPLRALPRLSEVRFSRSPLVTSRTWRPRELAP